MRLTAIRTVLSLCILTFVASLTVAAESEWPGWRGPNPAGRVIRAARLYSV